MPAVTADTLALPRLPRLSETETEWRPVTRTVTAQRHLEGEGFQVRRPFPGVDLALADPFLLLDHMGAVEYGPGEAKGTPWHPHRGFETVTYIVDGAFQHQDTTGGGGLISDGATQWMTAGAGIQHIEQPPPELVASGGISSCRIPAPAVIHWVAPSVIRPPPPVESWCSTAPSMMYVTVSKPRCGCHGAPLASPGAYSTAPRWSSSRNGSARSMSMPGNGRRTWKPSPSNFVGAATTRATGRKVVSAGSGRVMRGSTSKLSVVAAGKMMSPVGA